MKKKKNTLLRSSYSLEIFKMQSMSVLINFTIYSSLSQLHEFMTEIIARYFAHYLKIKFYPKLPLKEIDGLRPGHFGSSADEIWLFVS